MAPAFYTVTGVAERVGATPLTVRRWLREGKIPACRIGPAGRWLIPVAALDALLNDVDPPMSGPIVTTIPADAGDGLPADLGDGRGEQ